MAAFQRIYLERQRKNLEKLEILWYKPLMDEFYDHNKTVYTV